MGLRLAAWSCRCWFCLSWKESLLEIVSKIERDLEVGTAPLFVSVLWTMNPGMFE